MVQNFNGGWPGNWGMKRDGTKSPKNIRKTLVRFAEKSMRKTENRCAL